MNDRFDSEIKISLKQFLGVMLTSISRNNRTLQTDAQKWWRLQIWVYRIHRCPP